MPTKREIDNFKKELQKIILERESHLIINLSVLASLMNTTRYNIKRFLLIGENTNNQYGKLKELRDFVLTLCRKNIAVHFSQNKLNLRIKETLLIRDFGLDENKIIPEVEQDEMIQLRHLTNDKFLKFESKYYKTH